MNWKPGTLIWISLFAAAFMATVQIMFLGGFLSAGWMVLIVPLLTMAVAYWRLNTKKGMTRWEL